MEKFIENANCSGDVRYQYQIKQCGPTEYQATNGSTSIWADGINEKIQAFEDAKYIKDPAKSPYVEGSNVPDFVREGATADIAGEMQRYSQLIADENVPIKKLIIYVNLPEGVPYFQNMLIQYGIPGEVIVAKP
ncbi:MAG: hypothetical protein JWO09_2312 [Bacteroidetes bacterium]|nr:hypothetical protein [Bacteroidota bacterium]